MSRPIRRQVQQVAPQYAAVSQASPPRANSLNNYQTQGQATQPQIQVSGPRPVQSNSVGSSYRNGQQGQGRNAMAMKVATGSIGAGYGPYSVRLSSVLAEINQLISQNSIAPNKPGKQVYIAPTLDLATPLRLRTL